MLPDLLLPTYVQMLGALSAWLAKGKSQRPTEQADALLAARLAPDMFPLSTQVRFACVQAQEGVFRLQGQEFPPSLQTLLDEGRNAGERPGTIADAQARIAETLALVEAVAARRITIHLSLVRPARGSARACDRDARGPYGVVWFDLLNARWASTFCQTGHEAGLSLRTRGQSVLTQIIADDPTEHPATERSSKSPAL